MRESDYREVEKPRSDLRLRTSVPPFVVRRLVKVYHGRFCFKIPGVRCGPNATRWARERGQEEELDLGASTHGIALGFKKKHTYKETLEYVIGPYASVSPCWCHDDSELHVYESASPLSAYRYRRRLKVFHAPDPGYFFGNYVHPDRECWQGGPDEPLTHEPPGPTPDMIIESGTAPLVQLVEPLSFWLAGVEEQFEEPEAVAAAAAQVIEDDLRPMADPREQTGSSYDAGIIGLGGEVLWLVGPNGSPPLRQRLAVASAGPLARDRGHVSLSDAERRMPIPVLAFGGETNGVRADLQVLARGDGGTGEVWSGPAVLREDPLAPGGDAGRAVVTTFWGQADLSGLPSGVAGSIHGRVYDRSDEVVADVEVPFWTEEEPERVVVAPEPLEVGA